MHILVSPALFFYHEVMKAHQDNEACHQDIPANNKIVVSGGLDSDDKYIQARLERSYVGSMLV